ncbi:MAG TPA: sulfatase [Longimicrobiaceae bacterium]|nr:sulfatase [Longimicrobiaceae bacterium]
MPISPRGACRICLALGTAAALVAGVESAPAQQPRPNIVFLFSDDHAAHAISAYRRHLAYGARLPDTPNLDRLAASGMLFRNAFVTNSICGPARAAVLTGQYGHLNGVMTNREPFHPDNVTFPKLLRAGGYRTALFGKWHLKSRPQGFDHYEILAGQGPYYNPTLHTATDTTRHTGYTLDIVTDRALEWVRMERDARKPFLLMLHFNAPHRWWDPGPDQLGLYRDTVFAEPATLWDDASGRASPARDPEMKITLDLFDRDLKLEAPNNLTPAQRAAWDAAYGPENEAFRAAGLTGRELTRWRYQRYIADYARVVAALDAQVGRVLDALDRAGLARNTVVVYTSDQGFFLGDHGWFDKRWMYEESLRTPLLVRWPGVTAAGSVNEELVMNLDLAETFLEIGGVPVPATMQGRSLAPLLRGRTPRDWRDAIYYQYFEYPGWHSVRRQYGVRTRRHKLIHYYEVGEWELFDLDRDPHELGNLYDSPLYRDVVRDLKATLERLRREFRVPERDPVPYLPSDVPPEYRRPGAVPDSRPDTAKAGEEAHRHTR